MARRLLAELVRVFHAVKTAEAQAAVDALVERKTPLIWSSGIANRVLDTKLNASDQTLLLLHQALGWVSEADLVKSVEYSNPTVYRAKVLVPLHKVRKIEYDKDGRRAHISPVGSAHVETKIIGPKLGKK